MGAVQKVGKMSLRVPIQSERSNPPKQAVAWKSKLSFFYVKNQALKYARNHNCRKNNLIQQIILKETGKYL
jgi:hypothetical protein